MLCARFDNVWLKSIEFKMLIVIWGVHARHHHFGCGCGEAMHVHSAKKERHTNCHQRTHWPIKTSGTREMNHTQQFRDLCVCARARSKCRKRKCKLRRGEMGTMRSMRLCLYTWRDLYKKSNINFWLVPSTFVSLRAFFRVVLFSFFCSFIGGVLYSILNFY